MHYNNLSTARSDSSCVLAQIESGKWRNYSVFLLAFSATLREGIESVIFLAGVTSSTSATAIPIPGIIGIILGLAVGVFLYYS